MIGSECSRSSSSTNLARTFVCERQPVPIWPGAGDDRSAGGPRGLTSSSKEEATVPSIANPCSPTAALSTYRRAGFLLALFMLLCCSTGRSYGADTLDCPEIGSGSVPDLIGDAS